MNRRSAIAALLMIVAVLMGPSAGILAQGGEVTATVTSVRALVHSEPSASSETVETLSRGTLVVTTGFDGSGRWMEVQTLDGVSGWVSQVYMHINGPYMPGEGLLATSVDGKADDWARFTGPFLDDEGDSTGGIDLRAVRSFMNDTFLYVLVEADGNLDSAGLYNFDLVTNTGGVYETYQYALPGRQEGTLFRLTEDSVEAIASSDVVARRDEAVEWRMPLALLGNPDSLNIVAVGVQERIGGETTLTDELVEVMPAVVPIEAEPVANGQVIGGRINLRAAPVDGAILRVLTEGVPVSVLARTADSGWLLLRQDDSFQGWMSAAFVSTEVDVDVLPVLP